ncbi:MAG: PHP domain-containing protein [Propionibacteriaceae bacterium]|nr:PHP domain-containing protein [Propionibacteriaceae bacterium]
MLIDLHTHSNVSDGTDTPSELVTAAVRAGLGAMALCDHDTMDGVPQAQEAGRQAGVAVLRGLEMSTQLGGETVHLLGYGCNPDDAALSAALTAVREGREQRVPSIVSALQASGLAITVNDVLRQAASSATVGRPHVADALVALGIVPSRREAFDIWLEQGRPGYVGHLRIPLDQGMALINGAGGVAVLAHAWGRGTRQVLKPEVIAWLAAEAGLDGLEVDHNDHGESDRAALRGVATANGLIVTGSSDYHGFGKVSHELGCNTTSRRSYEAILALIAKRGGCP